MTAASPTQRPSARPTARTDRRRPRSRAWRAAAVLCVLLPLLPLVDPAPARAEPCPTASAAPEPLDLRRILDDALAQLASASTRDPDAPRVVAFEAERATVDDGALTLDGAVHLSLEALALEASAARLTADGAVELTGAHTRLDAGATLRADRLVRAPDGALRAEGLALRTPEGHTVRVERLALDAAATELVAEGIELRLCGCPDDDDGLLAPTARLERLTLPLAPPPDDAPLDLGEVDLRLAGLDLPLWTGPIHADGRATGLLAPRLGGGSETGFEAELPVFVRLGRHADLTLGAGWATAIGPVFSLRERHHLDPFTRGELALRGRYDLDAEALDLTARGEASVTVLERLRTLVRLDLLTRPALHVQRLDALWDRARRGGRSALALGWDGDQLALFAAAELLQTRPRRAAVVPGTERDEPLPDALPAVHRLPALGIAALAWPLGLVRFDLDARYTHATTLDALDHVDLADAIDHSVLGPRAAPRAGNGTRDAHEPLATLDHVLLRAGLDLPISLAGYGTIRAAVGLTQRFDIGRDTEDRSAFARETAVDVAAELATSLVAHGEGWAHVLRPRLAWRGRVAHSLHDRLGAPTVTGVEPWPGLEHALELALAARWLAAEWSLDTELLGVVMPDATGASCSDALCSLAALRARLEWADTVELRALAALPPAQPEATLVHATLALALGGVRSWLAHLHEPAASWLYGRPSGALPFAPWQWPRQSALFDPARDPSDTTELGVALELGGVVAAAAVGLVERPELGVEARAALGYTGECDCWNLGVAVERHAIAPTWDVFATLRLGPGSDEAAFYAPRLRAGGPL